MIRFSKITILIILLLIFSLSIKFWHLNTNPAGFFCDEALTGIDAISIMNTGKDHHSEFLPLFFKGFDYDNTGPYQVYLTIPSIGLFGLNERAIRLVPVFWSTIELLIFFLLLKEFIPKGFALIGTLLLSVSPWHFHISRINIADYYNWTLFTLTSYFFLVKAFNNKRTKCFILSSIFFGLTTYGYTPARLTTPLLFSLTLILLLLKKYYRQALLMFFVYSFILIPFIHFHLTDPHSFQRIKYTMGIDLNSINTVEKIDITKTVSSKLVINKYLQHFSRAFLFEKGDADYPGQAVTRHSITGLGLLYPYQKILIITGLIWLLLRLIKTRKFELLFIIFLLLLFPISDTLTNAPTPYATRSYLGVLPFHILIAFGVYAIFRFLLTIKLWNNKIVKILSGAILIFLVTFSTNILLVKLENNPLTTSGYWGWQYGPRDIMKYFLTVKDNYDELYMSPDYNAPEIFLKFYDPYNKCNNKCIIGDLGSYQPSKRQLFALNQYNLNQSKLKDKFLIKKTLYYPNGDVAFLIGEVIEPGN